MLAFGSAEAEGPAQSPGASSHSLAIKITTPAAGGASTTASASPPNAAPAVAGVFAYPADGSVVSAQSTTASATTTVQQNASAKAESVVTALSLFGGEVTADAVTASASAGTGPRGPVATRTAAASPTSMVDGQPVSARNRPVGTWGQLTVGSQTVDHTAAAGTKGYQGVDH